MIAESSVKLKEIGETGRKRNEHEIKLQMHLLLLHLTGNCGGRKNVSAKRPLSPRTRATATSCWDSTAVTFLQTAAKPTRTVRNGLTGAKRSMTCTTRAYHNTRIWTTPRRCAESMQSTVASAVSMAATGVATPRKHQQHRPKCPSRCGRAFALSSASASASSSPSVATSSSCWPLS